jgi:hypothetical protein
LCDFRRSSGMSRHTDEVRLTMIFFGAARMIFLSPGRKRDE